MANFKKYFAKMVPVIILLVILLLPSFVQAVWWNPFSWNIWQKIASIFYKQEVIQIQQEKKVDEIKNPAPSEVEGWKTYTNTEYGFEIKYPSDWIYDFDFRSSLNDGKGSVYFCPPELQNKSGNGFNPNEKGCMAKNSNGGSVWTLAPINLSQCDIYGKNDLEKCVSTNLGIDKKNNYGYDLRLLDSKYKSVYEKILSTFKFIP